MLLVSGKEVVPTIFPDKTSQVWLLDEELLTGTFVTITWKFESEAELFHLAQLKMLLDSRNIEATLSIPYLPYARQDKKVSNDTTFALHTFAKILNSLKFKFITVIDPHSDETLKLINNCVSIYPVWHLNKIRHEVKADLFCYPDKGALNKYKKVYAELNMPYIYGEKVRNQLTGMIESYKVVGECEGKNVFIVDDLVDGGATFIFLAKELLNRGAKEVNLFATHGIFSKGVNVLFDAGIKRIFTKNGEQADNV